MNIGRLDRKIFIEKPVQTQYEYGEFNDTWETFHICLSNVQAAGGAERYEANTETATNKVKFKIRYFAGINEAMRILYNDGIYDIYQIQELGREGLFLWGEKKV
jgi:SPP1 family predicted phage head-tail adaptor